MQRQAVGPVEIIRREIQSDYSSGSSFGDAIAGEGLDRQYLGEKDAEYEDEFEAGWSLSSGVRTALLLAVLLVGLLLARMWWNQPQTPRSAWNPANGSVALVPTSLESDAASKEPANVPSLVNIPAGVFDAARHPDWQLQTLNIENIRVGMRVPAVNPEAHDMRHWFSISPEKECDGVDQVNACAAPRGSGKRRWRVVSPVLTHPGY